MVNLYKKGCVETITVGELVEYLQTFPGEMRVAYTWERQKHNNLTTGRPVTI